MTALGLGVGWLVGYWISVIVDFLPRYSSSGLSQRHIRNPFSGEPIKKQGRNNRVNGFFQRFTMPAIIQFAQALAARKSWSGLPSVLKLNLAVEVVTAILFAIIWTQALSTTLLAMQSLLCAFLILVAMMDLRYRLVLNILIFPAMVLALLMRALTPGTSWLAVLLGGLFGFAIFALVAMLRPGQLGGGDVKLATLIGLVFAFPDALWALLIGVLAGGVASVWMLASGRGNAQTQIAYAPFLVFGALVALFFNPVPLLMYRFQGF
ncbi:MAG: prepilin peptidase [Chloroflexi bacterium]|nr:prepilin peptidase [Chloroflexota bacterium]